MSTGPRNVTTTTNSEPPAFITPQLTNAVNAAGQNFQQGRNGPGSQITGNSQNLINDTIQGGFLNNNPYLDQTFDRAAQRTQTQLASEFAGSGRNLEAALPARSSQLQDLAAQIYGGNYQAERDRQVSAVDQGQGLDPLNMFINQLSGVIPGAGGSTTSTQPVFRQGMFSDRRLKNNIQRIGTIKGYPWYAFEYIWGERSEGVMSDEIPQEFVYQDMGYDVVDYASLLRAN